MRLELEVRTVGAGNSGLLPERGTVGKGRKVAVVHAYGIGPAGFAGSTGEECGLIVFLVQVPSEFRRS